jgi:hypothetical protein
MNITVFSRNRLYRTFKQWEVSQDFADPMANYLVYGYEPGSCFTAVLANDWIGAVRSSHPSNTVEAFKGLGGWIYSYMPREAYGDYVRVRAWLDLDPDSRRVILERNRLIYTPKEETWMGLKGYEELEALA